MFSTKFQTKNRFGMIIYFSMRDTGFCTIKEASAFLFPPGLSETCMCPSYFRLIKRPFA